MNFKKASYTQLFQVIRDDMSTDHDVESARNELARRDKEHGKGFTISIRQTA